MFEYNTHSQWREEKEEFKMHFNLKSLSIFHADMKYICKYTGKEWETQNGRAYEHIQKSWLYHFYLLMLSDCLVCALCVCSLMNKQHDMLTNFLICTLAIICCSLRLFATALLSHNLNTKCHIHMYVKPCYLTNFFRWNTWVTIEEMTVICRENTHTLSYKS